MDEDEYAIHEAEQAFAVLVDRFGATTRQAVDVLPSSSNTAWTISEQRRAKLTPEQAEELNKMVGKLK